VCFDTTRDLSQAQDLSQEAFLRAYRKLRRLRRAERFAPWLIGITKHVCREWRRSVRRGKQRIERVARFAPQSECDPVADEEDLQRLREALAALPRRERAALHVFYLQEHPADAAAKLLGLSRSGFYRRLERARKRIQRMLDLAPRREVLRHDD
jgi:RNA polymerase sigma-70 factor (ECF subfamily)